MITTRLFSRIAVLFAPAIITPEKFIRSLTGFARLSLCTLLFGYGSLNAATVSTITFDPPSLIGGSKLLSNYTEGAMQFSGRFGHSDSASGPTPQGDVSATNGSAYLSLGFSGQVRFERYDGGLFDLLSVDLAEYSTVAIHPPTIVFIGYFADFSKTTTIFTTDNIIQTFDDTPRDFVTDFETLIFDSSFRDLLYVELIRGNRFTDPLFSSSFAMDNIKVEYSTIPLPGALVMLLSGLFSLFGIRFLWQR